MDHWIAFAVASALIAILPGPGVANIVGYAVNSGRATAFAAIFGAVTGNIVAMTLALAGAGALLAKSPLVYGVLELAGAAYLIAIGLIAVLRAAPSGASTRVQRAAIPARGAFVSSVAVSALNPKSIFFFVVFVPQFISPAESYPVQALLSVITFAIIVAASDTIYALAALRVVSLLSSPATVTWARRSGGGVMIATGLFAASAGLASF